MKSDLLMLARDVQVELTRAKAKLSELQRQLGELPADPDPASFDCPQCGPLAAVRSLRRLEEHLINVHGQGLEEIGGGPPERVPRRSRADLPEQRAESLPF